MSNDLLYRIKRFLDKTPPEQINELVAKVDAMKIEGAPLSEYLDSINSEFKNYLEQVRVVSSDRVEAKKVVNRVLRRRSTTLVFSPSDKRKWPKNRRNKIGIAKQMIDKTPLSHFDFKNFKDDWEVVCYPKTNGFLCKTNYVQKATRVVYNLAGSSNRGAIVKVSSGKSIKQGFYRQRKPVKQNIFIIDLNCR